MIDCSWRSSRVWIASINRGATRIGAAGAAVFFRGGANVEHVHRGQRALLGAAAQFGQPVLAFARVVERFERGRGRAEHDGHALQVAAHDGHVARVVVGRFLLLVGVLLLLVDDDDAEFFQRRENAGARADDDAHAPGPDVLPLVMALARGEMTVQHGHADLLPDEPRAEMLDGLRRERDFRHQDERGFSVSQHPVDGLEVDLGLAAAGDAVQQHDARLGRGDFLGDHFQRRLLFGVRLMRGRLGHGRMEERVAVLRLRLDRDEVAFGQRAPSGGRGDFPQIGEPAGAVGLEMLPSPFQRLGFPERLGGFRGKLADERRDPKPLLERRIGAAHRLRQHGLQRDGQRRAVVIGQPPRQLDQRGRAATREGPRARWP